MQVQKALLRGPAEFDSTRDIGDLMQNYFLKLLSRYRDFVEPDYLQGPSEGPRGRESASGQSGSPSDGGFLK